MKKGEVFLVTGGFGFLGSRLLVLLHQRCPKSEMIVVTRKKRKKPTFYPARFHMIQGDLCRSEIWRRLPRTLTHIFYLAASLPYGAGEKDQPSLFEANLIPLAHLIQRVPYWKRLRQIIYSSSISVYGTSRRTAHEDSPKRPDNFYGKAKLAGEKLLLSLVPRHVSVVCLRYSSLYGSGQHPGTVLPRMVKDALQKKKLRVFGTGQRVQDFLEGEDAAQAILLAYQKKARGIFNIGSGGATSMGRLAGTVNRVFADGRAEVFFDKSKREGDRGNRINIQRAKTRLGFEPAIPLREGLTRLKEAMNGKPP